MKDVKKVIIVLRMMSSARHVSSHAMQCMLPRAEYELYYAGESASLTTDAPLALTCPYCGRMGLTEAALYEHACCEHSDLAVEVVSIYYDYEYDSYNCYKCSNCYLIYLFLFVVREGLSGMCFTARG